MRSLACSLAGIRRVFELIHLALSNPGWDKNAFERTIRDRIVNCETRQKDIARLTRLCMIDVAFPEDRRMAYVNAPEYQAMRFESVRDFFSPWLCPSNLQVIVVGDFPSYQTLVRVCVECVCT